MRHTRRRALYHRLTYLAWRIINDPARAKPPADYVGVAHFSVFRLFWNCAAGLIFLNTEIRNRFWVLWTLFYCNKSYRFLTVLILIKPKNSCISCIVSVFVVSLLTIKTKELLGCTSKQVFTRTGLLILFRTGCERRRCSFYTYFFKLFGCKRLGLSADKIFDLLYSPSLFNNSRRRLTNFVYHEIEFFGKPKLSAFRASWLLTLFLS